MEDNPKELIPTSTDNPAVRTVWYNGKLYFSLIDIVDYLKASQKPARSYWAQLKAQISTEGF
jgi:prophage antirepressor-like protein